MPRIWLAPHATIGLVCLGELLGLSHGQEPSAPSPDTQRAPASVARDDVWLDDLLVADNCPPPACVTPDENPSCACVNPPGCGIQAGADCKWVQVREAALNGTCQSLPDPMFDAVDRRLCTLGILLDGDLSDVIVGPCETPSHPVPPAFFLGSPAVGFIDRIADLSQNDPGNTGTEEPPRIAGDPSGFNIGCSVLWFAPDTNPADGVDDSFIYVGFDIADFSLDVDDSDGVPRQFDGDDNDSACCGGDPVVPDRAPLEEWYRVHLQSCTNLSAFDPASLNPNDILTSFDLEAKMTIDEPPGSSCFPAPVARERRLGGEVVSRRQRDFPQAKRHSSSE